MNCSKTFTIAVYGCSVKLSIVKDISKKYKAIAKKENLRVESIGSPGALFIPIEQHTYHIIYRKDLLTHYYIQHELCHVITQILADRDIKDDEARAYLTGHLGAEIYNFLNTKKIQIG